MLTDAEKFTSDPDWLAARAILEISLPGYAARPETEQRKILAGIASDFTTACLTRRPPASFTGYVAQAAEYRREDQARNWRDDTYSDTEQRIHDQEGW